MTEMDDPIDFEAKKQALQKALDPIIPKEGQVVGGDAMSDEEADERIALLVPLYKTNPIKYERERNKLKLLLGVSPKAIDRAVEAQIEADTPPQLAPVEKDPVAELIVIAKRNAQLWHSSLGVGYASLERDGHLEHHAIDSREFKDWLADKFGERHLREIDGELVPIYPAQEVQREAQFAIQAYARRGEERQPKLRVIDFEGDLWIDLGGPDWQGVRVSADGWRVISPLVPPLVRGKGMRALPLPQTGGRIDDLRDFVNPGVTFSTPVGWPDATSRTSSQSFATSTTSRSR
jgi:hypothetical protein